MELEAPSRTASTPAPAPAVLAPPVFSADPTPSTMTSEADLYSRFNHLVDTPGASININVPPPPAAAAPTLLERIKRKQEEAKPAPPPAFSQVAALAVSAPAPVVAPVYTAPALTAAAAPPSFDAFLAEMSHEPAQPTSAIPTTSYPTLAPPRAPAPSVTAPAPLAKPLDDHLLIDASDEAVEAQRRILESIQTGQTSAKAATTPNSVELSPGNNVTLYSQDATHAAIATNTAHLVKCLSCFGWMQVVPSATLVFCPTCQVVSPVTADNSKPATTQQQQPPVVQSDEDLARALQAQWDSEETATPASTALMPLSDIMPQRAPLTAAQRAAHIAGLSESQRAMHGFEETPAGYASVNTGTEVGAGRTVSSSGYVDCLKDGVSSAGDAVKGWFGGRGTPNLYGRGAIKMTGDKGEQELTYGLLEEDL